VTAFFIPGLAGARHATEDAYAQMRRRVEADTGLQLCDRRILELWSRRGGIDCRTEVGLPDPICGDTVLAIFDVGPRQPFVVRLDTTNGHSCEVLSSHAYSVTEFDS
jgi:hypothetical protein